MKTLVRKLRGILKKHGVAFVAVQLGYRDTGAIKKWMKRNVIPQHKIDEVKDFVDLINKGE